MDAIAVLPPEDSMIESEFDQGDSARSPFPVIFRHGVTLFSQPVEFDTLLRDAIGVVFFRPSGSVTCCLFDQLPYIVSKYRDAIVDFRA
jgi:hypothetical protein